MIKTLRKIASWLEARKCDLHFKWNGLLDRLKTKCVCERSTK